MKKRIFTLALTLFLGFNTINANAAEVTSPEEGQVPQKEFSIDVFEEKFDAKMEERQEAINQRAAERAAEFDAKVADAQERSALHMNIVQEYTPELVIDFEAVADAHQLVHQALFDQHLRIRTEFQEETNAGLEALKIELFAALEDGSMTGMEVRQAFKTYFEERRQEAIANKDAYLADIQALNAENDANRELAKALKAELRTALENEESETIASILYQLLDLANAHVEYDYAKLAILETY